MNTGRGRRAGNPDTRGHILTAAQRLFSALGFDKTSIRAVAREADVDPALVHHYFGDKVGLLMATARVAVDPHQLVQRAIVGDRGTLGWRFVATALRAWESPLGATMAQVARRQPALFQAFTGMIATEVIEVAVGQLGYRPEQRREKMAMLEALMGGMFMTRYVVRMEPMASLRQRDVVRLFGPLVQQVLDGT